MKKLLLFSAAALCAFAAGAKVRLPGAIGSGMVMQRHSQASLWGWADPGKRVSVKTSWDGKTYSAAADDDGRWLVKVATAQAGGPYSIELSDGERTTIDNVMLGEVWICSGQSNMEMPMAGNNGQPIDGSLQEILAAGKYRDRIRMITIPRVSVESPQSDIRPGAEWQVASPEVLGGWSAVAYYFARNVTDVLDVPVGLVVASWGGSAIETWMDERTALSVEGIDRNRVLGLKNDNSAVGRLYNGMILPIKDYTARGFLWYQGEANRNAHGEYASQQAAMVDLWRRSWNDEGMPFYFVQIAPYRYGDSNGVTSAFLIEAQFNSLTLIPNSGMAATTDIGDEHCIHPPQKDVVGRRLALLALSGTYGVKGFPAHGPVYRDVTFEGDKARVTFEYSRSLSPENGGLLGFEIAGADRVFVPAMARVMGGRPQVEVYSPDVAQPVAVRYAWRNHIPANLTDTYGVAAYPFRTDDWDK